MHRPRAANGRRLNRHPSGAPLTVCVLVCSSSRRSGGVTCGEDRLLCHAVEQNQVLSLAKNTVDHQSHVPHRRGRSDFGLKSYIRTVRDVKVVCPSISFEFMSNPHFINEESNHTWPSTYSPRKSITRLLPVSRPPTRAARPARV